MATERLSIFETQDEPDLSGFTPRTADRQRPNPKQIREIGDAAHFPSRQAGPQPDKRRTHHRKTGRTAQLAQKIRPEYLELLYRLAERKNWLLGETIEHAFEALERELDGEGT
jgi:hypothetical protein